MSLYILTNSIPRALINTPKISLRKLGSLTICLIVALLVVYFYQVIKITGVSFHIAQYEEKADLLSQENKALGIHLSQSTSWNNLATFLTQSQYVDVGKVHYIRILDNTVAAK